MSFDIINWFSKVIMQAFMIVRHYIGNDDYRLLNIETKNNWKW